MLTLHSFVGLTPGLLVCLGVFHWLGGFLGGRMKTKAVKQGQISRTLRCANFPPPGYLVSLAH